MKNVTRILRIFVVAMLVLWLSPKFCFHTIEPDEIGVRQSNFSGVYQEDLEPGWALRIPGIHKIIEVPISYRARTFEEGKKINWRDFVTAVRTLVKYRFVK